MYGQSGCTMDNFITTDQRQSHETVPLHGRLVHTYLPFSFLDSHHELSHLLRALQLVFSNSLKH